MHEVIISPLPMQTIILDLPAVIPLGSGQVPRSNAIAMAIIPSVTGVRVVVVSAARSTAQSLAPSPVVIGTLGAPGNVVAVLAGASGNALPPVVAAVRNVSVTAVIATASGIASTPALGGAVPALVSPVIAMASANAQIPTVIGDAAVTVPLATASGIAIPAVATGAPPATAVAPIASASASASVPVITTGALVTVAIATATAQAITPTTPTTSLVSAVKAGATAAAIAPTVSGESVVTGGGPGAGNAIAIPPTSVTGGGANFVDTFNRANGALGASWTNITNFTIVSNAAVMAAINTSGLAVPVVTLGTDNHMVQVTLNITPTTGDFGQLWTRYRAGPFDTVHGDWQAGGAGFIIYTIINSVEVQRAQTTGLTFVAGSVISMQAVGNVYTMKLNGVTQCTWTDTSGAVYGPQINSAHRSVAMQLGVGATGANHGYDQFTAVDI